MPLGRYTIPTEDSTTHYAGVLDSLCKGSGTNGLQKDFEKAVKSFIKAEQLKEMGLKITLGVYGYMSRKTAEGFSKNGNGVWLSRIKYFGWGIGQNIDKVTKEGVKGALTASDLTADEKFMTLAHAYGLHVLPMGSKSPKQAFILPANLTQKKDVKKLTYKPDPNGDDPSDVDLDSVGTSPGTATDVSATATADSSGGASLSSAMYFFANQFNSVTDMARSNMLQGIRALANDEPLWNYVKKAVNSSLRSCSSDPDGNFIAWYPDYYGKVDSTPHVIINPVELIDLTITQSDKEFYSHVFCPGVDFAGTQIDMMWTQGVVAIETDEAALADSALAVEVDDSTGTTTTTAKTKTTAKTAAKNVETGAKALTGTVVAAVEKLTGKKNSGSVNVSSSSGNAKKNEKSANAADAVSPILKEILYIPEGDEWKYTPRELYRRYGARPAKTQSLPNFAGGTLIEDIGENQEAEEKNKKSNKSGGNTTTTALAASTQTLVNSVTSAVESLSGKNGNNNNRQNRDNNSNNASSSNENSTKTKKNDDSASPQHILPYLYALYEFMYHWANQYQAKLQVTFMPEVFPGSRVQVNISDNQKIAFYVQSVTHNMSYTSGFTTTLGCICPVGNLVSGMVK